MKTFKDLVFEGTLSFGVSGRAVLMFDNGYGVSVVYGCDKTCEFDKDNPYELALIKQNGEDEGDFRVLKIYGYLDVQRLNKIMIEIQKLK